MTEVMAERAARVAAPAALALFAAVGAVQSERSAAVAVAIWAAVTSLGVLVAWRATTGWRLVAVLAVAATGVVALCHGQPGNAGWFGMCVLAGWAALGAPVLPAVALGAGLVGVFAVEWLASDEHGWSPWVAGTVFTVTAFGFSRRQRELAHQLREAQAGLAERARIEERNRIAADVHDVIGHALTVSLLHLAGARLALDDEPDRARAALAEAERLARASLDEVRATVGLARTGGSAGVAPLPSAADVADLVESFRRAGTTVDLAVRGDLAGLGGTRGLAVYRIVQESLTNAARHSDGSPVTVRIARDELATTVSVLSGGRPSPNGAEGSGLAGMRERAEAVGGRVLAGPAPGGWRVEAVLPP